MTGTAEQCVMWLMKQEKKGQKFDVKEHRERRSLDSNSYYWVLVSKLATKLHISNARLHNLNLRDVAPPFMIDGQIAMQPIPDTEEAENQILESETYHLRPTDGTITGRHGETFRWYVILRGSSTFNSAEMSALITKIVADCNEQGIQTATPAELEQMAALWEKRYAKTRQDESDGNSEECKAESMGA